MKRKVVDVYCRQDVRWKWQCSRMLSMEGRRYKLCRSSENGDGVGGVRVMLKEELCEKFVEVRRVSDRVMAVALIF